VFVSRYGTLGASQRIVSIGIPARGQVSGLAVVDGGKELLATAERGLAVIAVGAFSDTHLIQLFRPKALGGVPTGLGAGSGSVGVIATTNGVDVLGETPMR
jgi:hypothetical protein